MRAPDGPGEAPAGLRGGRKMLFFMCFYDVFTFPMHLASWLTLLALDGADFLRTSAL